jgi:hypothetical protein
MDPWAELESFLSAVAAELGGRAYAFYDSRHRRLLPFVDNGPLIDDLERARVALADQFGADFLGRGPAKRHLHLGSDLSFVGEPVLGAYLYVVILGGTAVEGEHILGLLDAMSEQLAQLVRRLPPIDGGPAAVAQRP